MKVCISPGAAAGTQQAPPAKSMAHRLLICAGLSEGKSTIKNVDESQDVLATIDCLRAFGAEVTYKDRTVTVTGKNPALAADGITLPCRECGSTLRFFIPLCLLSNGVKTLTGSETLMERPMKVYEDICEEKGLTYKKENGKILAGGVLTPGTYEVPGNISSQFISGLLFALPLLAGDSVIKLIPPLESRPYIDMTIEALRTYGVTAKWDGDLLIKIPGGQTYKAADTEVEGDFSNAAYIEGFNLAGGSVELTGLNEKSAQGDKIYKEYFKKLKEGNPVLNIADYPDLGPILMAGAAVNHGAHLTGTARLAIKESNRGEAMKEELAKLGIRVIVEANDIFVEPGPLKEGVTLDGHNDHRIVMALSMLLSSASGSITGAQAVNKSLPDFFSRIEKLGIGVTCDELDK